MESAESPIGALLDAVAVLAEDEEISGIVATILERTANAVAADAAGLLLADRTGVMHVVAGTPETTSLLEIHELHRHGSPAGMTDLTGPGSESPFAAAALALGMRAALRVPARVLGHRVGELTMLWQSAPVDTDLVERLASSGATLIATALGASAIDTALLDEAVHERVAARIALEQAKGMVAARYGITVDDAGQAIREFARDSAQSIDAIARLLADRSLDPRDLPLRGHPPSG